MTQILESPNVYTFPTVVDQVLSPGDFIFTIAGNTVSINIRASGREVT